jgi:hypothetical protein
MPPPPVNRRRGGLEGRPQNRTKDKDSEFHVSQAVKVLHGDRSSAKLVGRRRDRNVYQGRGKTMKTLKVLQDYFPMAVFTGMSLVFISENWRVELTEHTDGDFSKSESGPPIIRLKIFKKALNGEFVPGHREDFQLPAPGELAEQIEKYVQQAIGTNLRESI